MRKGLTGLTMGIALVCAGPVGRAGTLEPGTMVDATTVDQVKDLLPPEIYNHYKKGDYYNKLVDFPNSAWKWDDGFDEATKWNGEHLVLDEHKSPIDKTTGRRPEYT